MSTKILKVTYYRVLVGEFEVEVREGQNEDEAIRAFLPEAPPEKFHVVFDDFAEVESEDKGKRRIELTQL